MTNMSYCMCQNTAADLEQVYDNVSSIEDLSDDEAAAFRRIVKIANRIVDDFGSGVDDIDDL